MPIELKIIIVFYLILVFTFPFGIMWIVKTLIRLLAFLFKED